MDSRYPITAAVAFLIQWIGWAGMALSLCGWLAWRWLHGFIDGRTAYGTVVSSFLLMLFGTILTGLLSGRAPGRFGSIEKDKARGYYWSSMAFFIFVFIVFAGMFVAAAVGALK